MDQTIAIKAAGLGKAYRIWQAPADRLISPILHNLARWTPANVQEKINRRAANGYKDFAALSDINFEINRGEAVAIIGRNGSGKSTLLQIIAGTLQPSAGSVKVNGRVAALLELGSGFNPEFTGRENVFLTGTVMGLTKGEIQDRFAEIEAFAEIGDFIEQPVKTYSSGMMVRLAFAVQTTVNPDVLIVDEALSVGDFFFQQKCAARMQQLRQNGTTLLFVSHDMSSVRDLCERTLYLKQGKPVMFGESAEAIAAYFAEDSAPTETAPSIPASPTAVAPSTFQRFKDRAAWWCDETESAAGPATLLGVAFLDRAEQSVTKLQLGHRLRVQGLFRANEAGQYHFAAEFKNRHDLVATSLSTYTCGSEPVSLAAGQAVIAELEIEMNFEAGRYTCQAVVSSNPARANRGTRLDASPWLGPLELHWDYENERAPFLGMFGPPARARFLSDPAK